MPEILKRVPEPSDSVGTVDDAVDSYWLPYETGYHVKLDISRDQYTLSWETPLTTHEFIRSVLEVDGITEETARGQCTINGETTQLEMGQLPSILSQEDFPDFSNHCSYCKVKDEFDGQSLEIDWVSANDKARIELTTQYISPTHFGDYIDQTTDSETVDKQTVELVIEEAEELIHTKQRLGH